MERCVKLSDCLQGKVFGLTFKNGAPYTTRGLQPLMVIIVDGNWLDGNSLDNLNANDIYRIEVLRSGANMAIYSSSLGGRGALVITSKRGGEPNYVTSEVPSGLIIYPIKGFYKYRAFYTPKHNSPKTNDHVYDLRNTLLEP